MKVKKVVIGSPHELLLHYCEEGSNTPEVIIHLGAFTPHINTDKEDISITLTCE
jgi:hypothetical protein